MEAERQTHTYLGLISRLTLNSAKLAAKTETAFWHINDIDETIDRETSHKASDLPIPYLSAGLS